MKLVSYISGKQIENIERLYMEAFPCEERKPFDVMLEKLHNMTHHESK